MLSVVKAGYCFILQTFASLTRSCNYVHKFNKQAQQTMKSLVNMMSSRIKLIKSQVK